MERKLVEFIVEMFGEEVWPSVLICWSDQCAAQFKSRFTMHKLSTVPASLDLQEPATVVCEYFETGEGKNLSDSIGTIVKSAYQKAAGFSLETTGGVCTRSKYRGSRNSTPSLGWRMGG